MGDAGAEFEGEVSTFIDAAAARVYALVSDVTRMGEWSPETVRASWLDGATGPAPGARFKGTNRVGPIRWSTTPTVLVAEPGEEFAFRTKETVWRYRFAPEGSGTRVTESFVVERYGLLLRLVQPAARRRQAMLRGMEATLARLKAAAERHDP